MTQSLLSELPVLSESEIAEYLQKHDIGVEKLSNGTTLLSANREVADEQETKVRIIFRIGANKDPKAKEGLVHFAEHMVFSGCPVAPNLQEQVMRSKMMGYNLNGNTNLWDTRFILEASSGLTNSDWGIQPGLEHLFSMLFEPFLEIKALESERGVILDENRRNFSSLGFLSTYEIRAKVFPKNHPMLRIVTGREESIKIITQNDVENLISNYYTPENAFVVVFSQGSSPKHRQVLNLLKDSWAKASRKRKGDFFSLPPLEGLSVYKPLNNRTHNLKTDVRKNRIWVGLAYADKIPHYSREGTAFDMASALLRGELFHSFRGKGFGYEPVFDIEALPLSGVTVLKIGMEVDKSVFKFMAKNIRDLFNQSVQRIIETKLYEKYVKREKMAQLDRPIGLSQRVNQITIGLRDYNQLIRSEDVRNIALSATAEEIKTILERLVDSPKGCFICGDF